MLGRFCLDVLERLGSKRMDYTVMVIRCNVVGCSERCGVWFAFLNFVVVAQVTFALLCDLTVGLILNWGGVTMLVLAVYAIASG